MSEVAKKSFSSITWQVSDLEFRSTKMYSYSRLSRFAHEGPKALIETKAVDTESLRFGSLVDCLLTSPEELENEFLISDFKKPPQRVMDLLNYIWEHSSQTSTSLNSISDKELIAAADIFEYLPSYANSTRLTRIRNSGTDYFRLLGAGKNKIKVTTGDVKDAQEVVQVLKTHPHTSRYLNLTSEEILNNSVEILFQLKLKAEYNNIPIKGKFDIIVVDHIRKTIYPIDLKTTGKEETEFEKSFIDFNYYIQAEMYTYMLKQTIEQDEYFKDFAIAPFKFMVINRFNRKPLIWEWNLEDPVTFQAREELIAKGLKPWFTLVEEANYHDTVKNYEFPYEALTNHGKMTINLKHSFYKKGDS